MLSFWIHFNLILCSTITDMKLVQLHTRYNDLSVIHYICSAVDALSPLASAQCRAHDWCTWRAGQVCSVLQAWISLTCVGLTPLTCREREPTHAPYSKIHSLTGALSCLCRGQTPFSPLSPRTQEGLTPPRPLPRA